MSELISRASRKIQYWSGSSSTIDLLLPWRTPGSSSSRWAAVQRRVPACAERTCSSMSKQTAAAAAAAGGSGVGRKIFTTAVPAPLTQSHF